MFIIAESFEQDFFKYSTQLGLIDKDSLILTPKNHFYYDFDEIKNVKTLVNLTKLNNIEKLGDYMNLICKLRKSTILYGCFTDSRMSNLFRSVQDAKMKRLLTKKRVSALLNAQNYKVLDMKEINEVVYFKSMKK